MKFLNNFIGKYYFIGTNVIALDHKHADYPTDKDKSYKCAPKQTLYLANALNETRAELHVTNLHFQAFFNTTSKSFTNGKFCYLPLKKSTISRSCFSRRLRPVWHSRHCPDCCWLCSGCPGCDCGGRVSGGPKAIAGPRVSVHVSLKPHSMACTGATPFFVPCPL